MRAGKFVESLASTGALDHLRAPGVPAQMSEKDRAVELARAVLRQSDDGDPLHLLARQLLRALGLSEHA